MEAPVTTEVLCSACSATIRVRADLAGKRVKCPKCQAPVSVPNATPDTDDSDQNTSTTPRWLFVGATVLLSFAVGIAGGYVFRHRQDKSDDKSELAEALAQLKSMTDKLKVTESNLAESQAHQEKLKLASVTRDSETPVGRTSSPNPLAKLGEIAEKGKAQAPTSGGQDYSFIGVSFDAIKSSSLKYPYVGRLIAEYEHNKYGDIDKCVVYYKYDGSKWLFAKYNRGGRLTFLDPLKEDEALTPSSVPEFNTPHGAHPKFTIWLP